MGMGHFYALTFIGIIGFNCPNIYKYVSGYKPTVLRECTKHW